MQANNLGLEQSGFDNNCGTQKQSAENKQHSFYPASTLMQIMRPTQMHKYGKTEGAKGNRTTELRQGQGMKNRTKYEEN